MHRELVPDVVRHGLALLPKFLHARMRPPPPRGGCGVPQRRRWLPALAEAGWVAKLRYDQSGSHAHSGTLCDVVSHVTW